MGNGARVVALVIGTYLLSLPFRLVLNLDNHFYVPTFTKNIIFVSCLSIGGYHLSFRDNSCSIMLNKILYASGTLNNEIYILDMSSQIMTI